MIFEQAEGGALIDKDEFEKIVPELRVELINTQYELQRADFPVIVLIGGDDRIAANELLNTITEWMDARHIGTHVFSKPSDEESERPRFWRYWRTLPAKGKIGVFVGAWAMNPIAEQVFGKKDKKTFKCLLKHINAFERALVDDGALLLKYWLHLPEKEHKKRAKGAQKGDDKYWKFDDEDWKVYKILDEALPLGDELIRATDTACSPWHLVETTDKRHRDITVFNALLEALRTRLDQSGAKAQVSDKPPAVTDCEPGALEDVDLSLSIEPDKYKEELRERQVTLKDLSTQAVEDGRTSILVFEGWDAAGKGGTIRRLTQAMQARDYSIIPIAAPTDEELAHHYLWRFWRHLPRAGKTVIFDRSWYGRVLVERVEGYADSATWQRAYDEINDFEALLAEQGMNVLKFWLHIDPDEQLRRFEAREETPYKMHKITDEDYRNREKWDAYVCAVNEMVERTSTREAPWHLIPANDKRLARLQVLKLFNKSLKKG
jgi:polyphosphate:AMP phosphotransferase